MIYLVQPGDLSMGSVQVVFELPLNPLPLGQLHSQTGALFLALRAVKHKKKMYIRPKNESAGEE